METVLVTGGAGFIGSHVVEALLESGYKVKVFDNFSTGRESNLVRVKTHDHLQIIKSDIRNWKAVHEAVDDSDHCIHLAGQPSVPVSMENPRISFESNLLGFVNLLDGLRQRVFTGRLIYASDASVYGNVLKHKALKEHQSKDASFTSPYSLDKQEIERMAELHSKLFGLNALGLRLFNVYGRRQNEAHLYSNVITDFTNKLSSNQMLTLCGDGNQTRDFIHVDDAVDVILKALKSPATGVLNVGTGKATSVKELARSMGKLMAVEPQFINGAERPGDIRHSCADTTKLFETIGDYKFTRLREGLMKTIKQESQTSAA